jgi:hypothetical protein
MIQAHNAIARLRRDLVLGSLVNAAFLASVFICVLIGASIENALVDLVLLVALAATWTALGFRSMRGSRLVAGSPQLIAAGEFDQAETQIDQALRSFSLFRTSKLLSLHHLALLRHAQKRFADAAELCRALLKQRLGGLRGLSRQSRLILADSLLELGDLRGSYESISALYQERLTLAEALRLLAVQLDYGWRVNAWASMLEGVQTKVQLAELMNTPAAARTQALLALAARRMGRTEWEIWLRRRVELLVDVRKLVQERPVLGELWGSVGPSESENK